MPADYQQTNDLPANDLPAKYQLELKTPSVTDYCHLRLASGLSAKTIEAATIGLAATLFAVQITLAEEVVAMGRLVGDGGCHCQVCDIAVLPEHQGQGLGKMVMQALMDYIGQQLPASCYINLIADGDARYLYEKYGFTDVAPASIGMALPLKSR
ncbi:N-acetyltransferase [Rheinheimera riviphila]|uniref:N-acetyltransferase n=1 Tax=Rheinheimera riviphila TaxID=1834037 RepID=A0A437QGI0_9GAMM|nr:GNAT family N-acetyltransferase [Rheinheimera riviphila]RVU33524.1 N-acetyltransferase [Rheinheimera riviphila]